MTSDLRKGFVILLGEMKILTKGWEMPCQDRVNGWLYHEEIQQPWNRGTELCLCQKRGDVKQLGLSSTLGAVTA